MNITGGEFFASRELRWLTSARAGNVSSLITADQLDKMPEPQRQLMTGITIIDIADNRWLVCTDTHRLHAFRTRRINGGGRPEPGHYQPSDRRNRYDRTEQLFIPEQLTRLVRQALEPHTVRRLELQLSGVRSRLRPYAHADVTIVAHADANGLDVHDRRTGDRIESITCAPLLDRRREIKTAAINLTVLWPALVNNRIKQLSAAGDMQPFISSTSEHIAVIMPTHAPTAAAEAAA
jgi:hypothetical protein